MAESIKNGRVSKEHVRRQTICKICNGKLKDASFIERCQHVFCLLCIQKHTADSNKCPVCDKEFTCYLSNISNNLKCQMFYVEKRPISIEEKVSKEKVESCSCNCQNSQQNGDCNHKFCRLCFQRSFLKLNECLVCCKRLEELITNRNSSKNKTMLTSQSNENVVQNQQLSSQSAVLKDVSSLHKSKEKQLNRQIELTEKNNRIKQTANRNNELGFTISNRTETTSQSNENVVQNQQLPSQSAVLSDISSFHKSKEKQLNGQIESTEKNNRIKQTANRNNELGFTISNRTKITSQSNENVMQNQQLPSQSAVLKDISSFHKSKEKQLNGQIESTEENENRIKQTANRNNELGFTISNRTETTSQSKNVMQNRQLPSQSAVLSDVSSFHKSKKKKLNGQTELTEKNDRIKQTANRNNELGFTISNRTKTTFQSNENVMQNRQLPSQSAVLSDVSSFHKSKKKKLNGQTELTEKNDRIKQAANRNNELGFTISNRTETTSQSKNVMQNRQLPSQSAVLSDVSSFHKSKKKQLNGQIESTEENENRIKQTANRNNELGFTISNRTETTSQSKNVMQNRQLPSQSAVLSDVSSFHKSKKKKLNGQTELTEKNDRIKQTANRNNELGFTISNRTKTTSQSKENVNQNQQLPSQSVVLKDVSSFHKSKEKQLNGQIELTEKNDRIKQTANRNNELGFTISNRTKTTFQSNENVVQNQQLPSQSALLKDVSSLHKSKEKQPNGQIESTEKSDNRIEQTANRTNELGLSISNTTAVPNQNTIVCSESTNFDLRMKSLEKRLRVTFQQMLNGNVRLDEQIRNIRTCNEPSSSTDNETPGQSKDIDLGNASDNMESSAKQLDLPDQEMVDDDANRDEQAISSSTIVQTSSIGVQEDLDVGFVVEPPRIGSENERSDATFQQLSNGNTRLDDQVSRIDVPAFSIAYETPQQSGNVYVCEKIEYEEGPIEQMIGSSVGTSERTENDNEIQPSFTTLIITPDQVTDSDFCTDLVKMKSMVDQFNLPDHRMEIESTKLDERLLFGSSHNLISSTFNEMKENDFRIEAPNQAFWEGRELKGKSKSRQNKRSEIHGGLGRSHCKRLEERPCGELACQSLVQPSLVSRPHPASTVSRRKRQKKSRGDDNVIKGNFCIRGSYNIRRQSSPSKPPEIRVKTTYQGDCPATELLQLMGGCNESQNSLQQMLNSGFQDCNMPFSNYGNQGPYLYLYQGPRLHPLLYTNQGPCANPGQYMNQAPYANPGQYMNQGPYANPGPYVNIVPYIQPCTNPGPCVRLAPNEPHAPHFSYF